jgi:hypothetical protein
MGYYSNTPPTMGGFTVFFSKAFRDRDKMGVPAGFQSIFKMADEYYSPDSDIFTYDVSRSNTRTAEFISRDTIPGTDLDRKLLVDDKYTNFSRQFPLSQVLSYIPAKATLQRQAGEKLSEKTRRERLQDKLIQLFREQSRQIIRLNEMSAASVIQTGKMAYKVESATFVIDFKRVAGNTIACGATWDSGSGDPAANFKAAILQSETVGSSRPNVLLLDGYSTDALFSETSIAFLSDIKGYNFIEAGSYPAPANLQHLVDGGFMYRGRITIPSCPTLDVFVCRETYTNSSGVITPYMTAKTALLFNTEVEYRVYIGPTGKNELSEEARRQMEDLVGISTGDDGLETPPGNWIVRPGSIEHDIYENEKRTGYTARTQSSVVFAPVHTDSIITLTGCAT